MITDKQVPLPSEVAGVHIPDTALVYETTQFVSDVTPMWLLNHLFRTYIFAELLGRKRRIKYDSELLYLGALTHDLGLTREFASAQHVELDGADAGTRFPLKHCVPKNKIDVIWDSIAFHTSRGIFDRAVRGNCSRRTWRSHRRHRCRDQEARTQQVQELLETWPRHGFRYPFPQLVADVVGLKPEIAAGSFAADVLRDRGISVPNICEAMALHRSRIDRETSH